MIMENFVGKNKYGEKVELKVTDEEYTISVTSKSDDKKETSKKDKDKKEEKPSFGSYSNTFSRKTGVEVRGLRSLPEGKTEVTLKFAGEPRKFVFVVDEFYSVMQGKI